MNHVVLVNFEGFVDLTTDLGGVTVTNKTGLQLARLRLPQGQGHDRGGEGAVVRPGAQVAAQRRPRPRREPAQRDQGDRHQGDQRGRDVRPGEVQLGPGQPGQAPDGGQQPLRRRDPPTAFSLRLDAQNIRLMQAPLAGFGTVNGQSIDVVDTAKMAELGNAMKTTRWRSTSTSTRRAECPSGVPSEPASAVAPPVLPAAVGRTGRHAVHRRGAADRPRLVRAVLARAAARRGLDRRGARHHPAAVLDPRAVRRRGARPRLPPPDPARRRPSAGRVGLGLAAVVATGQRTGGRGRLLRGVLSA